MRMGRKQSYPLDQIRRHLETGPIVLVSSATLCSYSRSARISLVDLEYPRRIPESCWRSGTAAGKIQCNLLGRGGPQILSV